MCEIETRMMWIVDEVNDHFPEDFVKSNCKMKMKLKWIEIKMNIIIQQVDPFGPPQLALPAEGPKPS